MEDNKRKSKISPGSLVILIGLVLISAVDQNYIPLAIGAVFLIAFITWIVSLAKKSSNKGSVHSHDRINTRGVAVERHEGIDHYRIQLDGFLRAGIIDRKEYNVLLKKYTKELQKNK